MGFNGRNAQELAIGSETAKGFPTSDAGAKVVAKATSENVKAFEPKVSDAIRRQDELQKKLMAEARDKPLTKERAAYYRAESAKITGDVTQAGKITVDANTEAGKEMTDRQRDFNTLLGRTTRAVADSMKADLKSGAYEDALGLYYADKGRKFSPDGSPTISTRNGSRFDPNPLETAFISPAMRALNPVNTVAMDPVSLFEPDGGPLGRKRDSGPSDPMSRLLMGGDGRLNLGRPSLRDNPTDRTDMARDLLGLPKRGKALPGTGDAPADQSGLVNPFARPERPVRTISGPDRLLLSGRGDSKPFGGLDVTTPRLNVDPKIRFELATDRLTGLDTSGGELLDANKRAAALMGMELKEKYGVPTTEEKRAFGYAKDILKAAPQDTGATTRAVSDANTQVKTLQDRYAPTAERTEALIQLAQKEPLKAFEALTAFSSDSERFSRTAVSDIRGIQAESKTKIDAAKTAPINMAGPDGKPLLTIPDAKVDQVRKDFQADLVRADAKASNPALAERLNDQVTQAKEKYGADKIVALQQAIAKGGGAEAIAEIAGRGPEAAGDRLYLSQLAAGMGALVKVDTAKTDFTLTNGAQIVSKSDGIRFRNELLFNSAPNLQKRIGQDISAISDVATKTIKHLEGQGIVTKISMGLEEARQQSIKGIAGIFVDLPSGGPSRDTATIGRLAEDHLGGRLLPFQEKLSKDSNAVFSAIMLDREVAAGKAKYGENGKPTREESMRLLGEAYDRYVSYQGDLKPMLTDFQTEAKGVIQNAETVTGVGKAIVTVGATVALPGVGGVLATGLMTGGVAAGVGFGTTALDSATSAEGFNLGKSLRDGTIDGATGFVGGAGFKAGGQLAKFVGGNVAKATGNPLLGRVAAYGTEVGLVAPVVGASTAPIKPIGEALTDPEKPLKLDELRNQMIMGAGFSTVITAALRAPSLAAPKALPGEPIPTASQKPVPEPPKGVSTNPALPKRVLGDGADARGRVFDSSGRPIDPNSPGQPPPPGGLPATPPNPRDIPPGLGGRVLPKPPPTESELVGAGVGGTGKPTLQVDGGPVKTLPKPLPKETGTLPEGQPSPVASAKPQPKGSGGSSTPPVDPPKPPLTAVPPVVPPASGSGDGDKKPEPPKPPPVFDDSNVSNADIEGALKKAGFTPEQALDRMIVREGIDEAVAGARTRADALARLEEAGLKADDPYARQLLTQRGAADTKFGKAPTGPPTPGSPEDIIAKRTARVGDSETLLAEARERAEAATKAGNTREATRILEKEIKPLQEKTAYTREELDAQIRTLDREPTKVRTPVEMSNDPLSKSHNPTGEGRPGMFEFLAPGQQPGTSKYFFSPDVGNGGSSGGGAHGGGAYKVFTQNGNGTFTYMGIADAKGRIVMTPGREKLTTPIDALKKTE